MVAASVLIWLVCFVVLAAASRRPERGEYSWWQLSLAGIAGLVIVWEPWLHPTTAAVFVVAGMLALIGLSIALAAYWHLGRARVFSPDPEPVSGSVLLTRGPFRIVRHPAYLGILLLFLSVGFAFRYIALVAWPLLLLRTWTQARTEDSHLEAIHGDTYSVFHTTTPDLIIPGDRWLARLRKNAARD